MKRTLSLTRLAALAGAILFWVPVTQAQGPNAIYFEEFGNTNAASGNNFNVTSVFGWQGYWGPTALPASNPSPNNFGISSSIGSPQGYTNVNAGAEVNSAHGYLFTSGIGAALTNWIAYETNYTVNTSVYSIQDISFYCASTALAGGGTPTARVAVQIGGNWYVTSQVFSNTYSVSGGSNVHNPPDGSSTSGAQRVTFTWTTSPSAWNSLTFVPGSSLAMGSVLTSPLPGGNITGFGLYSDPEPNAGSSTRRFDSYEIDASVAAGPPIAGFNGSPTNGPAPLAVTFTDTSSGTITNWSWTFGDGGITNLTSAGVTYTYNTPGLYSVTEIVTGPGGSSTSTASNYITVSATSTGSPVASFYGSPTSGLAPLQVTFTDTSSGTITNWSWTFGDGSVTNLTSAGVTYTYNTPGLYSVTEIVTGPGGSSTSTASNYVTVSGTSPGSPVASFYGSQIAGPAPLAVTFTDTSSGTITNWSWTFGDGGMTNLTSAGVTYTYNTPGLYSVTEIVTGPGGSSTSTASNYVTVSGTSPGSPYVSRYVFGVNSNQLTLNGHPFKILGLRCANAQISDATTSQLISNLDVFKSYGVNTVTVYVMGSRFGDIQGYHPNDTLDPTYTARLGEIIQAADARGMVVLVGCLYWGTSLANSQLGGWTQADANRAVSNTVVWLSTNNYRNVFVDPDNEGMAEAAMGWSISQEIDAAHSVDKTIMVAYNYTATPPTNADLYIHYSPVVSGKPWLNTESTPNNAPDGGYWNAYSKQTYTSSGGSYYNYSRIGRYTSDMQTDQENQTISGYQYYNGNCLASSWLQCGPYAVNGPFMTPGGLATNQNVDVNVDVLNPDAGILWWLEFIQAQYGAWTPPTGIIVRQAFFTPDRTNFVLSGTGGSPTGLYAVVTATDLGMSVSNWPTISTNRFDAGGNFAATNPVSPFDSQRFYSIYSVSPPSQTQTGAVQNLLIDPSFENLTPGSAGGWTIVQGAVLSTTFSRTPQSPPTGGHSIQLPAGTTIPIAYQGPLNPNLTNIVAGQQFELTAYGMVTNAITSGFSGVQATFFSASGVNLGTVETSPGNAIFSNKIDSNNTVISTGSVGGQTWIPLSTGVFTAPAGTAYMDVYAISVDVVESNGVAGSWIDDLNLVTVP